MTTVDQPIDYHKGRLLVSTDKTMLDLDVIHDYLSRSYWSANVPREIVARSLEHAICFGVYDGQTQVGFARVISDYATFAYLSDMFILEAHQRQGLGKWLLACIIAHPDLHGLRRWMLVTSDAQGLYERYGFRTVEDGSNIMHILRLNIYGDVQ